MYRNQNSETHQNFCVSLLQGLMRIRGRPAVAYDEQGLVFAVSMEGGAIKLFDVRSYDKVRRPCLFGSLSCWDTEFVYETAFTIPTGLRYCSMS